MRLLLENEKKQRAPIRWWRQSGEAYLRATGAQARRERREHQQQKPRAHHARTSNCLSLCQTHANAHSAAVKFIPDSLQLRCELIRIDFKLQREDLLSVTDPLKSAFYSIHSKKPKTPLFSWKYKLLISQRNMSSVKSYL